MNKWSFICVFIIIFTCARIKSDYTDTGSRESKLGTVKLAETNNTSTGTGAEPAFVPESAPEPTISKKTDYNQDWFTSFIKAFSLIFVSEIADKSFIMVLYFTVVSHTVGPVAILLVSFSALILMCVLSVFVGYAMPFLINKSILEWIAIFVFASFGIYSFYQGCGMEYEETVEKKLEKAKEIGIDHSSDGEEEAALGGKGKESEEKSKQKSNLDKAKINVLDDLHQHLLDQETHESGHDRIELKELKKPNSNPEHNEKLNQVDFDRFNGSFWYTVWIMFSLVCLAEWGDKTMFSTIVIASVYNVYGVFFGAVTAYFLTCLFAVLAGNFLGKYLNEKIMCYIGGLIFIFFSLEYLSEKLGLFEF